MRYQPDIIVDAPDTGEILLVAEVKAGALNVDRMAAQLFEYLRDVHCELALLIGPEHVTIFRDRSLKPTAESMERIGPLPLGHLLARVQPDPSRGAGSDLEARAQSWLDELVTGHVDAALAPETRDALTRAVVPFVLGGRVRTPPPRRLRSA